MGPEPATDGDKAVWRAVADAIQRASDICAQRRAELRRLSEENYRVQGVQASNPVVVIRNANATRDGDNRHHHGGKHKHRR